MALQNLKLLRETLCYSQALVSRDVNPRSEEHIKRLQDTINAIDVMRPLDKDGKHRRHTIYCGCDPNEQVEVEAAGSVCRWCGRSIIKASPSYEWTHIDTHKFICVVSNETSSICYAEPNRIAEADLNGSHVPSYPLYRSLNCFHCKEEIYWHTNWKHWVHVVTGKQICAD